MLSAPESPGEAAPGPGGEAEPDAAPGQAPALGEPGPGGAEDGGPSDGAAAEPDPEAAPARPSQNIAVQVGASGPGRGGARGRRCPAPPGGRGPGRRLLGSRGSGWLGLKGP